MFEGQGPEELRRRGLELQAQLPEPSPRALARAARRQERAGPVELAAGGTELLGIWGALFAVPAAVIWWISRRRRHRPPH